MSHWINKTFRNTATTPMIVSVAAHVAGSFVTIELDDEVTDILATGAIVPNSDDERAEQARMHKWINQTFIGKPASHFHAHNGIVPDAIRVASRDLKPEVRIVNTVNIPNVSSPEAAEKISRIVQRTIARSTERENVGHEGFASAPHPGTYWQDKERPTRFFCVTSKSECEGHTHVSMTRVDYMRGGMYDYPYENAEQWGKMFRLVSGSSVPDNPYANNSTVVYFDQGKVRVLYDGIYMVEAADLTDAQIDALVKEHGVKYPGLREFLVEERARKNRLSKNSEECKANFTDPKAVVFRGPLGALKSKPLTDPLFANWLLGDDVSIPQYIQSFLDSAGIEANELPPQPGERYFSVVTGNTYTVVDVARKLHHETDYYITMERDGDKHRTKFTYRNHASWLVTWRPADDEGNAREVTMVDIEQQPERVHRAGSNKQTLTFKVDAEDVMKRLGEAMHVASEEARRYFIAHEDSAIYDLVRIGDELEKRLPGWRKDIGHWEKPRTESDMIIRALRTLTRQRDNASLDLQKARREVEELKEQNKMQLALAEVRNKEIAKLKQERGGSWGPERVETEKKRMRDMLQEYCLLFKHNFGVQRLRVHVTAFGARSLHGIPLEQYIDFMKDCRAYADKAFANQADQ